MVDRDPPRSDRTGARGIRTLGERLSQTARDVLGSLLARGRRRDPAARMGDAPLTGVPTRGRRRRGRDHRSAVGRASRVPRRGHLAGKDDQHPWARRLGDGHASDRGGVRDRAAHGPSLVDRRAEPRRIGGGHRNPADKDRHGVAGRDDHRRRVGAGERHAPHRGGDPRPPARERPPRATRRPKSPTDGSTTMSGTTALVAMLVAYGLFASRLEPLLITAPIFFVVTGLVLGSSGLGILPSGLDSETTLVITELTLGVLLFADAATVRLREVEGDARLPVRLLLVGLPLTIALGTVAARLLFAEAGWAAAALIASILAPTDAALGLAVVTNPAVPARIRRALNVESGLNDGIATPFVTLFLTLVIAEEGLGSGHWAAEAAKEIGLALVAAVAVGVLGGKLLVVARRLGWTSTISEQLVVLALSLLAYVCAVAIGGNGFVAAFVGGLLFGASTSSRMHEPVEFTETVGLFASFFVWTVFGALFVGPVITGDIEPVAILYAVVSLTLVRMVPVAAAVAGVGLRRDTVAFMGWFGPRGLASVVFTLIAVEELHGAGPVADVIVELATWTILLSVVAHGLSARPLARIYGRHLSGAEDIPELAEVPEPRIRRRSIVR